MDDLEKLRTEIDLADAEIVHAFERRMDIAKQVAQYKIAHGLPVLDKAREEALIKSRENMLSNNELRNDVDRLYELLMSLSRERQRELVQENKHKENCLPISGKVGYAGVRGAYADMAQNEYFGGQAEAVAFGSFEEVFAAVEAGQLGYGVLPIENSYAGSVEAVYDLLNQYNVCIVAEQLIHIEHALLGVRGADISQIKEVYSHDQGLLQSAAFLSKYPLWKKIPYYNTAASAKYIAEAGDVSKSAIASKYAAEIYGLTVLADAINSSKENTTRFIIIGKAKSDSKAANKASLSFVLEHKAGALAHILDVFADMELNMVKIESRPLKYRNFEYRFYVDFAGEKIERVIKIAMDKIAQFCTQLKLLGVYENGC
ncbi:MAG: prephenate dehydratase domain-containing protein [Christensenella sp.]